MRDDISNHLIHYCNEQSNKYLGMYIDENLVSLDTLLFTLAL